MNRYVNTHTHNCIDRHNLIHIQSYSYTRGNIDKSIVHMGTKWSHRMDGGWFSVPRRIGGSIGTPFVAENDGPPLTGAP